MLRASLLLGILLGVPMPGFTQAPIHHELITEWKTNPVEYRALIKQALEAHHGALALILIKRAPDSGLIPLHVEALVALTKLHGSLYPEGSETPHTSDRIWTDAAEFHKASQRTAELAQELPAVIDRGDMTQSVNAVIRLGESCQACHARYRITTPE
jgi:cytochrome c556